MNENIDLINAITLNIKLTANSQTYLSSLPIIKDVGKKWKVTRMAISIGGGIASNGATIPSTINAFLTLKSGNEVKVQDLPLDMLVIGNNRQNFGMSIPDDVDIEQSFISVPAGVPIVSTDVVPITFFYKEIPPKEIPPKQQRN